MESHHNGKLKRRCKPERENSASEILSFWSFLLVSSLPLIASLVTHSSVFCNDDSKAGAGPGNVLMGKLEVRCWVGAGSLEGSSGTEGVSVQFEKA